ncbi:MAG: hypothetical protein IPH82_27670 [Chloroflexi bacterium]|nr:hypothetical protein [Chloroflexota bacterium]MBK8935214.1 hypothetical protein [Chloroflexota bacterium]
MVKNKADCSSDKVDRLPESAHQWMRQFRAAMPKRPSSAVTDSLFPADQDQTALLPFAEDGLQTFRDWHYLTQPDTSVAALDIDNDLFLLIIQEDIFTVAELKECLHKKFVPGQERIPNTLTDAKIRQKLLRAIKAWARERQPISQTLRDY